MTMGIYGDSMDRRRGLVPGCKLIFSLVAGCLCLILTCEKMYYVNILFFSTTVLKSWLL